MEMILVSGINGFVGHHLAREIKNRGYLVAGIGQEPTLPDGLKDVVDSYFTCDLTRPETAEGLPIKQARAIINLAGLANVGASFQNPELYKSVNVKTLTTLCDLIKKQGVATRIIAVSTGAVYDTSGSLPFNEDSSVVSQDNTNPYVTSKLLMEELAKNYADEGLDCIIVRPFNHIGPGQRPGFLIPDLFENIQAAVATGRPLTTGNLSTKRDYTDVRDVVKAYGDLALAPPSSLHHHTYNVCSGIVVPGTQILNTLLRELSPNNKIETVTDPSLIRPNDPATLYGDHARLTADTNWVPKISLEQTIKDFIAGANR